MEWLSWFAHFENTKPLALVIFFVTFCGVLYYVFGDKKRSARLESYRDMPLRDE